MVEVTPFDDLDDVDCRWQIEGVGIVFGRDIEKELKAYYREKGEDEE